MARQQAEGISAQVFGAVLFAASFAYYLIRHDIVLGDPDIWWHIQSGLDMIATRRFPVADSYSYTFAGEPWIAKEWLSQVLLALGYKSFGWNGVTFLAVASASLAMALLFFELARHVKPAAAAAVTLAITVVLTQIVIARPHIFTLPLTVIFAAAAFRAADEARAPPWWLLAVTVLWANLHGSFTLAFMIAGLAFVHLVIAHGFGNRAVLFKWVIFGLLLPVAALINPYGWTPFQINLAMLGGVEAMALITEWQPFNAQREVIVHWGLMAALALLIGLRVKLGWGKVIFIIFALHMFFTHIRFVYVFFLAVPVVIAINVARDYPAVVAGPSPRRWPVAGAIVAAALAAFTLLTVWSPFAPPPRRSIEGALAYIKEHKLDAGPVFNGYNLGGVLIFNGIKPYIDGRAEQLFRGRFITDFIASTAPGGEKVLREILETVGITWTIMPVADVRNAMMADMAGWARAYGDDYVIIYVRQ